MHEERDLLQKYLLVLKRSSCSPPSASVAPTSLKSSQVILHKRIEAWVQNATRTAAQQLRRRTNHTAKGRDVAKFVTNISVLESFCVKTLKHPFRRSANSQIIHEVFWTHRSNRNGKLAQRLHPIWRAPRTTQCFTFLHMFHSGHRVAVAYMTRTNWIILEQPVIGWSMPLHRNTVLWTELTMRLPKCEVLNTLV